MVPSVCAGAAAGATPHLHLHQYSGGTSVREGALPLFIENIATTPHLCSTTHIPVQTRIATFCATGITQ